MQQPKAQACLAVGFHCSCSEEFGLSQLERTWAGGQGEGSSLLASALVNVGAGMGAVALAVGLTTRTPLLIAALLFLCAVVVLLRMPMWTLPATGLTLLVLIPVGYLPNSRVTNMLSPALLVMTVWGLRMLNAARLGAKRPALVLLALAWLAGACASSIALPASLAWSLNFVLLVVLPWWLAGDADKKTVRALLVTWLVLVTTLAVLAIVESRIGRNPISVLETHYNFKQTWAGYRVTTTLGHPLVNGTFFAMSTALAGALFLQRRHAVFLVPAALGGFAALLTLSRGASLAVAAAVAVIVGAWILRGSRGLGIKVTVVALAVAGMTLIFTNDALEQRSASAEAISSAALRVSVIEQARFIAKETNYLGAGPGASVQARDHYLVNNQIRFESSFLQILVEDGYPGLIAFGSLLFISGAVAFWRRNYPGLGLVVAYTVSLGTYESIDESISLLLLGLSLFVALSPVSALWLAPGQPGKDKTVLSEPARTRAYRPGALSGA